jgi:hypothetical protein
LFRGRDAQDIGEELEGSGMFVIPEFPDIRLLIFKPIKSSIPVNTAVCL